MRHLAALLSGALLLLALALFATHGPVTETEQGSSYARSLEEDAAAQPNASRLARLAPTFRGGPITTSTGEVVDVRVSDALPVETSTAEGWAEFLVHLTHGSELGQLQASIVTFDEVQEICGSRALGCYGRDQLVAPGETVADTSAEEVVRHEYGHHVAAHRRNPPWDPLDWGPKHWSSSANVCARAADGTAFPGDEGLLYDRNPGEAFAETYRVLNETRAGLPAVWPLLDESFVPTAATLAAVDQDVLQPWLEPTKRTLRGRFRPRGPVTWSRSLATPLDGDLDVVARLPIGAAYRLSLVTPDGHVAARGLWSRAGEQRLQFRVCGQRTVLLRVARSGGAPGAFSVLVTEP